MRMVFQVDLDHLHSLVGKGDNFVHLDFLRVTSLHSLSSLAFDTSNCFAETSYAVVAGTRGRQVSVVRVLSVLSIPYSIQPDWKPICGSDDG